MPRFEATIRLLGAGPSPRRFAVLFSIPGTGLRDVSRDFRMPFSTRAFDLASTPSSSTG